MRLQDCAKSKAIDLTQSPPATDLAKLHASWEDMKPKLAHLTASSESTTGDSAMDLVFQIEQQTQKQCSPPQGMDEALTLLAQEHMGAER